MMAPENEQAVCITCGLCCDGTLFGHAVLKDGEKGSLPDLIEKNVFILDGKNYFRLPCLYFEGRCTIYGSSRADVCGSYRCRLLGDMAAGRIRPGEAFEIVRRARLMRQDIREAYRSFSGNEEELPLTVILRELGRYHERMAGGGEPDTGYEMLQAQCNIFEALLIRHFRPESDFENMVMK
jgi:hypothetical protein